MAMQTSTTKNQDKATAQFAAHIAEARELLAKLTDHADNHMGVNPENLHWGHVGDAARLVAGLRDTATTLLPE